MAIDAYMMVPDGQSCATQGSEATTSVYTSWKAWIYANGLSECI